MRMRLRLLTQFISKLDSQFIHHHLQCSSESATLSASGYATPYLIII